MLKDLCRVGTWQLEPLPDGRKTIGSKLVHKTKYRADGSFDKDKSRLVALGFLERAGIDFHATYSPMASLTAVRLVLSLAVHNSLPIYHADVPQAFLRADLDTEVYLTLPKGINIYDETDTSRSTWNGFVLRLLRSLYGLKQAPQLWNKTLHVFFEKCGFTRADAEACLYYKLNKTSGLWCIVLCEVDDLVVTGTDKQAVNAFHHQLITHFAQILS